MKLLNSIRRLNSPPTFLKVAKLLSYYWMRIAILISIVGILCVFFYAPIDEQQGDIYRILFIHVPAAWMSMFLYLLASLYGVLHWIYRTKVSAVMMRSMLPTGVWMTILTLITGALWGKSTWGAYWVWDARLTSELLLLFIYLGLIAFAHLVEDHSKTDRALVILILVGLVNIPLIYFSVVFWNTLHQGATIKFTGGSLMATEMKVTLILCALSLWLACGSIVLKRASLLLKYRN